MFQHILISINLIRSKICAPVATPDPVDASPGPSQAHVRVCMSDTLFSVLAVPTSSCVNLFRLFSDSFFYWTTCGSLADFPSNPVTAAGSVVRAGQVVDTSSSILRLGPQHVDVGSDHDETERILREQREAATRFAALRLADLVNARQDAAVAQWTISRRALALGHTCNENSRLVAGTGVLLPRPTQLVSV